jgi:hypothetical protein
MMTGLICPENRKTLFRYGVLGEEFKREQGLTSSLINEATGKKE